MKSLKATMMNSSSNIRSGNSLNKENIPPSTKAEAFQPQRTKQRTALGVLSENEQYGLSFSQGSQFSRHSSVSDSSQLSVFGWPSSSSCDVYVEEACEVVLAASGQEVVSDELGAEANPLQSLLMEISSSSCQEDLMHEADDSLVSREKLFSDYAHDIHRNLRESEKMLRAKPNYLERHPEISSGMRVILVDWLAEVVQEYKLCSETLHLAINYLDRFLSHTAFIKRSKLQLVGTAALLIAAKYEEIFPPELNEFVYITDSIYSRKNLTWMENAFLRVLAFRMAAPTTNQFLCMFMSIQPVCSKTENLALYIAELSLLETDPFLQFLPSLLAAGTYCLAAYTINKSLWPDSLVSFTGYTLTEIRPCLTNLHKLYVSAESRPQQAIRGRYSSVAGITPPSGLHLV